MSALGPPGLPRIDVAAARRCPSCGGRAQIAGGDPMHANYACACGFRTKTLHSIGVLKTTLSTVFCTGLVAFAISRRLGSGQWKPTTLALLAIALLSVVSSVVMLARHRMAATKAPALPGDPGATRQDS